MIAMTERHRLVAVVGLSGAALGVVAGAVQAMIGAQIPEWSGAKAAPTGLGLLTIALSVAAGLAAVRQRKPGLSVWGRTACALALLIPGLLCLSTVGRLWYPSAVLLVIAGVMTVDSWRDTGKAFARDWFRVLLTALGCLELLMAAGAAPILMVVGGVGGIVLIAAAWLRSARTAVLVGLVVLGTVPFAALTWTAVVPVLLAVVAAVIAIPVIRNHSATPEAAR